MRLHLEEGLDLADRQVFPVTQSNQLIEGAEQLVCVLQNLPLVETSACAGDDLGEEVEGIDVLQDVGLLVRDEDHVELVQRLVHEADIVLLDGSVLGARIGELGERGKEALDA